LCYHPAEIQHRNQSPCHRVFPGDLPVADTLEMNIGAPSRLRAITVLKLCALFSQLLIQKGAYRYYPHYFSPSPAYLAEYTPGLPSKASTSRPVSSAKQSTPVILFNIICFQDRIFLDSFGCFGNIFKTSNIIQGNTIEWFPG
jgi:hypothetical protein